MSTRNAHVALPSAQNFHPEFGYFCPSAQVRRKVRSAALTILAGMVIAAGAALALVPEIVPEFVPQLALHLPGAGVREESTLLVVAAQAPLDRATDKGADETAAVGVPAAMTRPIPVTEQFAASRPQISCDDLSGSFLAPQCQLGKTGKARKSHMTRSARAAANQRIATLPIGRADPAVQDEQQRVGQQAEPRKVAASRSAPAVPAALVAQAMDDAPAVLPPEKPAVPAKKPVKTAHAPSGDKTGAEPSAAAPPPAFSLFGLFHELPRSGGGPLGDVVVERRARAL
jgi:hypothetical protein